MKEDQRGKMGRSAWFLIFLFLVFLTAVMERKTTPFLILVACMSREEARQKVQQQLPWWLDVSFPDLSFMAAARKVAALVLSRSSWFNQWSNEGKGASAKERVIAGPPGHIRSEKEKEREMALLVPFVAEKWRRWHDEGAADWLIEEVQQGVVTCMPGSLHMQQGDVMMEITDGSLWQM